MIDCIFDVEECASDRKRIIIIIIIIGHRRKITYLQARVYVLVMGKVILLVGPVRRP